MLNVRVYSGLRQGWKMYHKAIDDYFHVLRFSSTWYKTQKMCNKAVGTYPSAMQLVLECHKTQEMFHKAVHTCPFVFDSVRDKYMTQKCVIKLFPKKNFILKYCLGRYKTQEIWDEAVDAFLPALKFVPDWFFTSKMIEKLDNAVFLMMI